MGRLLLVDNKRDPRKHYSAYDLLYSLISSGNPDLQFQRSNELLLANCYYTCIAVYQDPCRRRVAYGNVKAFNKDQVHDDKHGY